MKNNQEKYRIYYISPTNEKITVDEFEAESRDEAFKRYSAYKNEHTDNTYYYKQVYIYHLQHKDGTVTEHEYLTSDIIFKKDTMSLKEKIIDKLDDIWIYIVSKIFKLKFIKYFLDDVIYWLKNYNHNNSTSHMRSELWSLDNHILEDLVFNIDKMIKLINNKNCGIADKYLIQARKRLQEKDKNYKVPDEILNCYSYTDEEFDLGRNIWINELDDFLHKIGVYNYLVAYGHFSKEDYSKYHMYADVAFYKDIIPIYEGTLNDIKYDELRIKIDKYWNEIWDWIKENGRDLWT